MKVCPFYVRVGSKPERCSAAPTRMLALPGNLMVPACESHALLMAVAGPFPLPSPDMDALNIRVTIREPEVR